MNNLSERKRRDIQASSVYFFAWVHLQSAVKKKNSMRKNVSKKIISIYKAAQIYFYLQ